MGSLREQRKAQRSDSIKRAANKLFRSKGYGKTSMEDVALEAGVSPATIYNYFGTKFAVLTALMEPEMQRVQHAAASVLANLPDDPLTGIVALSSCYELGPEWLNRDLLMPFAKDFFLSKNAAANPINIVSDIRAQDFLKLFRFYKAQGKLYKDMNEEDAVVIIASLFQYHLKNFLFADGVDDTYDKGVIRMSHLERRIRCAVSGMVVTR